MVELLKLLEAQAPAWIIALLTSAGVVVMAFYQHLLLRRVKLLEHNLRTQAYTYERSYDWMRERHVKRVDALDRLNAILMSFNHDVRHVQRGDTIYTVMLEDNFAKARAFARDNESLLGRQVYEAVLEYTDCGRDILNASYCVTERTLKILQTRGGSDSTLEAAVQLVGKRFPIRGADDRTIEGASLAGLHAIFSVSTISGEFDEEKYDVAVAQFERLKDETLRTLPSVV